MAREKNKNEEVDETTESEAKVNFRKIIEAYAKQNPKKYALKREELEKKLNAIK
jgi:hypothetical protein